MKNKTTKIFLLVCSLFLAAALSGCGKVQPPGSGADVQGPADTETPQENVQSPAGTETPQENVQTPADTEAPNEDAQTEIPSDEPDEELKEKALSAYREILEAAPAIEAGHEELFDASFDYDQNRQTFGGHYEQFAFYDIDRDGIPELIALKTVNFRWTPVSVYT